VVHREANQQRGLPSLHREVLVPPPRHGRHHGQSRLAQCQRQGSRHPCRRRPALLPADILARSEPIEQFFAKFKYWLRKAALRTSQAVYGATAPSLDTVSSTECVADPRGALFFPIGRSFRSRCNCPMALVCRMHYLASKEANRSVAIELRRSSI
jgi:hypothetical protein